MRFQVPQFVDIEDKIIGPLTLKQFLIYMSAVLALIPVYLVFDISAFIGIAIPVLGTAAAFAHVRLSGQSLAGVLSHAALYYLRRQLYMWRRVSNSGLLVAHDSQWKELLELEEVPETRLSPLGSVAQSLETEGKIVTEDIDDPLEVSSNPKTKMATLTKVLRR